MPNEELLDQLDQALADLRGTVADLTEEQAGQVGLDQWNVKNALAHIAGWHLEAARMFDRMSRGERPAPEGTDYSNPDEWNVRFVEARSGQSLIEALSDLDNTYQELRARVEAMPEDRLAEGKTARRIVMTTGIEHYRDHGDQIRKWRQSQGL